ncbi:hypothetical protein ES707_18437 [subsurface metagenome]
MSYINDKEAFCLANTYNLSPPRAVYPARTRRTNTGKYEPDLDEAAETRCMVLAHFADKTNIIVQYVPAELEF